MAQSNVATIEMHSLPAVLAIVHVQFSCAFDEYPGSAAERDAIRRRLAQKLPSAVVKVPGSRNRSRLGYWSYRPDLWRIPWSGRDAADGKHSSHLPVRARIAIGGQDAARCLRQCCLLLAARANTTPSISRNSAV
jgi:hypothetical protein